MWLFRKISGPAIARFPHPGAGRVSGSVPDRVSGVTCVVDPPVPIPNTAVKRFCGDNTGGTSLWEDSAAPD
jgi:hypothetical protein